MDIRKWHIIENFIQSDNRFNEDDFYELQRAMALSIKFKKVV